MEQNITEPTHYAQDSKTLVVIDIRIIKVIPSIIINDYCQAMSTVVLRACNLLQFDTIGLIARMGAYGTLILKDLGLMYHTVPLSYGPKPFSKGIDLTLPLKVLMLLYNVKAYRGILVAAAGCSGEVNQLFIP